ncbi:hypothetical protein N7471_005524, partial [Penicillium samsonianum]|uniref:uncharacterized protein n=1 Tax=Penicillium samsonianum TaxID=1882272 RepID=UPI002546DA2D
SGDPPPKSTPLSLFPAFPFSSPKHLDTICFCRFICFFFLKNWSGLLLFSSNCEKFQIGTVVRRTAHWYTPTEPYHEVCPL